MANSTQDADLAEPGRPDDDTSDIVGDLSTADVQSAGNHAVADDLAPDALAASGGQLEQAEAPVDPSEGLPDDGAKGAVGLPWWTGVRRLIRWPAPAAGAPAAQPGEPELPAGAAEDERTGMTIVEVVDPQPGSADPALVVGAQALPISAPGEPAGDVRAPDALAFPRPGVDWDALLAGLTGLAPENQGPGAAAFFDVDNTTIRGSSFVALAKGMADRDYFTTGEIMSITWKQLKYVVSGRENMADIIEATENVLEFVKGREVVEIQTLSDEVYDEKMVARLWAGTLALTEAHLAAGHQVWLVSATPQEVAEVIAARLGLTGGLGTRAEVIEGRYTGKLDGLPLHGQVKADVISELAASHGLDLARCSAYSDSANDIPMLSAVGHPVAVNPDGRLRAHAKEKGWPIRDYRIRGKESVRKGVPAAAAAGLIAGAAVGVAKGVAAMRGDR